MVVDVRAIDPRDISWEEDTPVFRVTFWRRQLPPTGIRPRDMGYEARELEVSNAEVDEVITWAESEAQADETWMLHVTMRCPDLGLGQVLLAGVDPTTREHS